MDLHIALQQVRDYAQIEQIDARYNDEGYTELTPFELMCYQRIISSIDSLIDTVIQREFAERERKMRDGMDE